MAREKPTALIAIIGLVGSIETTSFISSCCQPFQPTLHRFGWIHLQNLWQYCTRFSPRLIGFHEIIPMFFFWGRGRGEGTDEWNLDNTHFVHFGCRFKSAVQMSASSDLERSKWRLRYRDKLTTSVHISINYGWYAALYTDPSNKVFKIESIAGTDTTVRTIFNGWSEMWPCLSLEQPQLHLIGW